MTSDEIYIQKIEWDDALCTGIQIIDMQHRALVRLLNDLNIALSKKLDYQLPDIILSVIDYAKVHFATEEELLEKYGYLAIDAHKKEHDIFRRKVEELKSDQYIDTRKYAEELLFFIKGWLFHHVKDVDIQFSGFLTSKGVS